MSQLTATKFTHFTPKSFPPLFFSQQCDDKKYVLISLLQFPFNDGRCCMHKSMCDVRRVAFFMLGHFNN